MPPCWTHQRTELPAADAPGALRLFLRRGAAISPCSGGSHGGICRIGGFDIVEIHGVLPL